MAVRLAEEKLQAQKELLCPAYLVWIFEQEDSKYDEHDPNVTTVDSLEIATAIARLRVQDITSDKGWALIIADKNVDNGILAKISKTSEGHTRISNKRGDINDIKNVQAQPGKNYIGQVLRIIDSDFLVQDIGRGSFVVHQASRLDLPLEVGDKAIIKYDSRGQGRVEPQIIAHDKSQSR